MSHIVEKDWTAKAGLRAIVLVCFNSARKTHRCGYVEVSGISPLFGADYNDEGLYDVECHGGLTFSAPGSDGYPATSTGHWFGFDCHHSGDGEIEPDESYWPSRGIARSLDYCELECENLASQLVELEKGV